MKLNLNFSDIPEALPTGPLPAGPYKMRIIAAEYVPAASSEKSPYIKVTVSPNVRPGDPLETRKLTSIVSLSPKDYPRQLLKQFFDAAYQTDFNSAQEIDLESLIGRPIVAVVKIDEGVTYTNKTTGKTSTRDFNKVETWLPDVADAGAVTLQ